MLFRGKVGVCCRNHTEPALSGYEILTATVGGHYIYLYIYIYTLGIGEEACEVLHLEHSFIWC